MIGSGLRKLAATHGMKVGSGIAYGSMRGYCATLAEGAGYKSLTLTTHFPDPAARYEFQNQLIALKLTDEFRLQQLEVQEKQIKIIFLDTVGTMKRVEGFIDRFFPLLEQTSAAKLDICSHCGMQMPIGKWKLIDGVALCVHEACARKIEADLGIAAEEKRKDGSYLNGALGAFLGATGGAIVWALVMMLGYITSIVGLLIGFLAEKGYSLLRGKNGWGKIAILIVSVIFGVLLGNFAAEVIGLMKEVEHLSVGESIELLMKLLENSSEARSTFIKNIVMGLLFAGLGVAGLLIQAKRDVAAPKCKDLD